MAAKTSLTDALEKIQKETNGDKISFGDLVEILNSRGFGALLIGPSLVTVLPTGAIPGIPSLCAIMIILISIQIIFGRKYPWIPSKLENITFDRKKFSDGVDKVKPYTKWIDGFFHPRFKYLTEKPAHYVVAVLCIALACLMIAFEVIPFAAFVPAFAILILGLGLSIHDGLLVACGIFCMCCAFSIVPFILG